MKASIISWILFLQLSSLISSAKTCTYDEESDSCSSSCGAKVTLDIVTNEDPEHTYWHIRDADHDDQDSNHLISSISIQNELKPLELLQYNDCLDYGRYIYYFSYTKSDANSPVEYQFYVNDEILDKNDKVKSKIFQETLFVVCSSDEDCHDYNACSIDECNLETNICKYTYLSENDCTESCSWLEITIQTDDNPQQTSWGLYDADKHTRILSGTPFPFNEDNQRNVLQNETANDVSSSNKNTKKKKGNLKKKNKKKDDKRINIQEKICIEHSFSYSFIIQDSNNDGICCASEEKGKYLIAINDQIIKEGGDFQSQEQVDFSFHSCSYDSECNDGNQCTNDVCIFSLHMCAFYSKPCALTSLSPTSTSSENYNQPGITPNKPTLKPAPKPSKNGKSEKEKTCKATSNTCKIDKDCCSDFCYREICCDKQ